MEQLYVVSNKYQKCKINGRNFTYDGLTFSTSLKQHKVVPFKMFKGVYYTDRKEKWDNIGL